MRRFLCWICGDRPFNARHQLVDHIVGAGEGGKAHMNMRNVWDEADRPNYDDWFQFLKEMKALGKLKTTKGNFLQFKQANIQTQSVLEVDNGTTRSISNADNQKQTELDGEDGERCTQPNRRWGRYGGQTCSVCPLHPVSVELDRWTLCCAQSFF